MVKSVAILSVILSLIFVFSTVSYVYINDTVDTFAEKLDKAMLSADKQSIKTILDEWAEEKKKMMYVINHRDIESVSIAIERAYRFAEADMTGDARSEISVAKFNLTELTEREKISFENLI